MRRTAVAAPPLPEGRPRLVVTGFMGTGKTTAGRAAADLLGMPFVDVDPVVERRAGLSIAEIFERHGEQGFRVLERDAVADAARLSGAVVATGGGAVLDRSSFADLARGAVVAVLTGDPQEVARRAVAAGRPLLNDQTEARALELLREREPAYVAAGEALDIDGASPAQVADRLAARYRTAVDPNAPVTIDATGSRVVVGSGTLATFGEQLRERLPDVMTAVVVADAGAEPVVDRIATSLGGVGVRIERVAVPGGEPTKSLAAVDGLWRRFRDAGLTRTDVVVAVGGGATLDAAGFAAATFARGIPLANAPTTLLAMVDASVGGKVGIDLDGMKNLIGAFHAPQLVCVDPEALQGLPPRPLRAGLAEAVKAAVVGSPLALDLVEDVPVDADGIPPTGDLTWIVEQALRAKLAFVDLDPFDEHDRHALNLGHTFAHAIESASGFAVPHGEAVSIGLVAAARLGAAHGVTDPSLAERLPAVLSRFGLPTVVPRDLPDDALMAALGHDKKRRGSRAVFVVPAPGGVELLEGVDPRQALHALTEGVRA